MTNVIDELNKFGEEEWELVSMIFRPKTQLEASSYLAFFKREKK